MKRLNLFSIIVISMVLISCSNKDKRNENNNYEVNFAAGGKTKFGNDICNVLLKSPSGQSQVIERFECEATVHGTDSLLLKDITGTKDFSYIDSLKIPDGYGTVLKQYAAIQNYNQVTNPASDDITFFRYILFKKDNTLSLVKELWEDNSFKKVCTDPAKEIYKVDLLAKESTNGKGDSSTSNVPENSTSQNQNSNIKTLDEIKMALLDGSYKKVRILLGHADKYGRIRLGSTGDVVDFDVFFDKVNDGGTVKHLVLFYLGEYVKEIYAVNDGESAHYGIHTLQVSKNGLTSNSGMDIGQY